MIIAPTKFSGKSALSDEDKREYYRKGWFAMNAPPVSTREWNTDAWIKHIDGNGMWCTPETIAAHEERVKAAWEQFIGIHENNE